MVWKQMTMQQIHFLTLPLHDVDDSTGDPQSTDCYLFWNDFQENVVTLDRYGRIILE